MKREKFYFACDSQTLTYVCGDIRKNIWNKDKNICLQAACLALD